MAKTLFGQWTLIWICRLEKGVVYLDLLQEKFIEFYLSIPITLVLLWCWDWPVLNKIKSLTLSLLLQLSPRLLDPCFDFFFEVMLCLINCSFDNCMGCMFCHVWACALNCHFHSCMGCFCHVSAHALNCYLDMLQKLYAFLHDFLLFLLAEQRCMEWTQLKKVFLLKFFDFLN